MVTYPIAHALAPTIYNTTLTNGFTEYSQALGIVRKFIIRCRTSATLQLAFSLGQSGTTYITIPAGAAYWEDMIYANTTLYFQSPTAGVVAEVIGWG